MGAHTVPLHPDATAAIVALIFFFGVVCLGCLWAMLLRHCRRAMRSLPPTPGLPCGRIAAAVAIALARAGRFRSRTGISS